MRPWTSSPKPPTTLPDNGTAGFTYDEWISGCYADDAKIRESGADRADYSIVAYLVWHHWSAFCMSWVTVAWAMLVGDE